MIYPFLQIQRKRKYNEIRLCSWLTREEWFTYLSSVWGERVVTVTVWQDGNEGNLSSYKYKYDSQLEMFVWCLALLTISAIYSNEALEPTTHFEGILLI